MRIRPTMLRLLGKLALLALTILALCYLLSTHLVATNCDVAIIWAYDPLDPIDYLIYAAICGAALLLSIWFFPLNRKIIIAEIAVYTFICLSFCIFGDHILSSIHFDWPMNYTPSPL